MSTTRSIEITDKDGDTLAISEAPPGEAHVLEASTGGGEIVYLTKPDLDELRSFLLYAWGRA